MSKEIRHSSYYNSGVYGYGDRSYDDGIGGFSYKLTRHSKTFIIINTIVTTMVEGKTFVLLITKFNNSVTAHIEITCLDVIVACTIVGASSLSAPLCLE